MSKQIKINMHLTETQQVLACQVVFFAKSALKRAFELETLTHSHRKVLDEIQNFAEFLGDVFAVEAADPEQKEPSNTSAQNTVVKIITGEK